jgi:hypothetical protein
VVQFSGSTIVLTATNGGTLAGQFASVTAYVGSDWVPPPGKAWQQFEDNNNVYVYWS